MMLDGIYDIRFTKIKKLFHMGSQSSTKFHKEINMLNKDRHLKTETED